MSNMTGLVPYQNLAQTAKSYGGPVNYTREIFRNGFCCGLLTGGSAIAIGVATYFVYKKIDEYLRSYEEQD